MAAVKGRTAGQALVQRDQRGERLKADGFGDPLAGRLPIQKWDAGTEIEGTLLSKKKLPDRDGRKGGYIFTMLLVSGERVCYGAPTLLWEAIEAVASGTVLNILCLGQDPDPKPGRSPAWLFEVRSKMNEEIPF